MPPYGPVAPISPARANQRLLSMTLGRYGGPELLAATTLTLTAPQTWQMPNYLNIDRPIESLEFVLRGRLVVGTAAYTAGIPESFANLLQNVLIQGNHVLWGNQTPVNISGATLFVLPRLFQTLGNTFLSSTTRQGDPGMPYVSTANLITTPATGTIDFQLHWKVATAPHYPPSPSQVRGTIPFMWRSEDWGNSLKCTFTFGDATALGTPAGGTTTTWTAFGSASGSPTFEVFANYSLLGNARFGYVPGSNCVVVRNEQLVPSSQVAVSTGQQLMTLQRAITTNIIIKSGIALTGTTAGVSAYASLSDVQLDRTSVQLDQKNIQATGRNYATKDYYGWKFNTVQPQGYFVISFIEGGNPLLALRADRFPSGAVLQVISDVLTASANNRQQFVQEQVYCGPGGIYAQVSA